MLLGEILVHEGAATAAQVEEALEAQVLNGGRLGTNLVELGHVTEEQLARALGRQHRVHCAHGEIVPGADALSLLDANVADEKDVLPVRLDGNRLYLLVTDPDDIEARDEVATRTGRWVVPVVVAEFRMAQLQRRYCKAFRPVREVDLEAIRRKREAAAAAASQAPAQDLMTEDEFQSLYAAAMAGGRAAAPVVAGASAEPEAELEEALIVGELVEPEAELIEPAPELVEPALPAPEAPAPERRHSDRRAGVPGEAPPVERRRRQRRHVAPEDTRPIGFPEAQKALAAITDRNDIARVVMRFAAGKYQRALLLQVQRDSALGWLGAGPGLDPGLAQRLAISLKKPSAFKLVRDSRSHYLGPLRRDFPTVMFLQALGGKDPRSALLMPILAAGRVVNILYADSGPEQFTSPDIGELLILSQKVGRSYEAMIAARRKAAAALAGR